MYYVYLIGPSDDTECPYYSSYVGVTNNINNRWKSHIKSDSVVGTMIRKCCWTFDGNMRIIHSSDSDKECFRLERSLRPVPMLGLNEAIGGQGGYTKYTPERNAKISRAHKGREAPWIHKVIENRPSYKGSGNPRAIRCTITSPEGNVFQTEGNLQAFAESKNLSLKLLRCYAGSVVPPPNMSKGGRGGFRARSPEHLEQRLNTTGWKLDVNS